MRVSDLLQPVLVGDDVGAAPVGRGVELVELLLDLGDLLVDPGDAVPDHGSAAPRAAAWWRRSPPRAAGCGRPSGAPSRRGPSRRRRRGAAETRSGSSSVHGPSTAPRRRRGGSGTSRTRTCSRADGPLLAVADRLDDLGGDAQVHQELLGGLGAALAELEVVLDGPAVVAVALDGDLGEAPVLDAGGVLGQVGLGVLESGPPR